MRRFPPWPEVHAYGEAGTDEKSPPGRRLRAPRVRGGRLGAVIRFSLMTRGPRARDAGLSPSSSAQLGRRIRSGILTFGLPVQLATTPASLALARWQTRHIQAAPLAPSDSGHLPHNFGSQTAPHKRRGKHGVRLMV